MKKKETMTLEEDHDLIDPMDMQGLPNFKSAKSNPKIALVKSPSELLLNKSS
jgi:hypothetical protein